MDHKVNIIVLSFEQALEINSAFDKEMPSKQDELFNPSKRLRRRVKVALCSSCGSSICTLSTIRDAEVYTIFSRKFPRSCDQIKNQNLVSEIFSS